MSAAIRFYSTMKRLGYSISTLLCFLIEARWTHSIRMRFSQHPGNKQNNVVIFKTVLRKSGKLWMFAKS